MEDALRESEARFRTLADNIAQFAWMTDGDGNVFWYNRRWYDYTGTTLEEVQGWGWQKVHHPDHVERVVAKLSRCFQNGQVWEDTFPLRGHDGEYRWFLSRALPIRDANGTVVRWFGTNTDVTEQREIEQKLIRADRQKDEFLAVLGHELRNPLAAIRSASELLKLRLQEDPALARTHAVLERQTTQMTKLLDGLLDVSRIIRGKIKLERERVDLTAICHQTVLDVAQRTSGRGPKIHSELPPEPVWVEGDRVRLVQIVDNLLSNAVKYTGGEGSVRLTLARDGDQAVLTVRDTGVGIEPDLLPYVFEVFRQSEQSLDRSSGGLGLGLALVKSLAELHGGGVEAESEGKDCGAQFVVHLPVTDAPPPTGRSIRPLDGALAILLIEDNEDAADMLRQVLQLSGHRVTVAQRGPDGVERAREQIPDVILCDLGLPDGMTGFDVAKVLRAETATQDVPLVALSGYGRPEDIARATEAGFDAHLTKPIDKQALERVLGRLASAPPDTHGSKGF